MAVIDNLTCFTLARQILGEKEEIEKIKKKIKLIQKKIVALFQGKESNFFFLSFFCGENSLKGIYLKVHFNNFFLW